MKTIILWIDVPAIKQNDAPAEIASLANFCKTLERSIQLPSTIQAIAKNVWLIPLDKNLPFLVDTLAHARKEGWGYKVFSSDSDIVEVGGFYDKPK